MIKIETRSEVKGKDDVSANCRLEVKGERYVVVSELAAILTTIEDVYPEMIGDALQLMLDKEMSRG